jgi:hypothetical protein
MCSEDVQKQRRYPEERAGNISPGGWRLELDPTVSGDVALSKVASSELTERGVRPLSEREINVRTSK